MHLRRAILRRREPAGAVAASCGTCSRRPAPGLHSVAVPVARAWPGDETSLAAPPLSFWLTAPCGGRGTIGRFRTRGFGHSRRSNRPLRTRIRTRHVGSRSSLPLPPDCTAVADARPDVRCPEDQWLRLRIGLLGAYIHRLPLPERLPGRRRSLGRNHLAIDNRLRRPEAGWSARAQHAGPDRLHLKRRARPAHPPVCRASKCPRLRAHRTCIHERVARNQSHAIVHPLVDVGDVGDIARSSCRRCKRWSRG